MKTLIKILGTLALLTGCATNQKYTSDYRFFNGDVQIDRKTTYNQTPICAENVSQTEVTIQINNNGEYNFQLFNKDQKPIKQWQTQVSKEQIPYREKTTVQGPLDKIEVQQNQKRKTTRKITYGPGEIKIRK
jgi:hypothetical protein